MSDQEWDFTADRPEGGVCIDCGLQQNYEWHECQKGRKLMNIIEDGHYEEARKRLVDDPIVRDMAAGLRGPGNSLDDLAHEDGTPRFQFMQAANAEYAKRGGTNQAHIGAVAEALLKIILGD